MSKDPTWPDDLHDFRAATPELPPGVVEALKALGELRGLLIEIDRPRSHCQHEAMARTLLKLATELQKENAAQELLIFSLLHLMGDRVVITEDLGNELLAHPRRIVKDRDREAGLLTLMLVHKEV
jgi:hypothetical protein